MYLIENGIKVRVIDDFEAANLSRSLRSPPISCRRGRLANLSLRAEIAEIRTVKIKLINKACDAKRADLKFNIRDRANITRSVITATRVTSRRGVSQKRLLTIND